MTEYGIPIGKQALDLAEIWSEMLNLHQSTTRHPHSQAFLLDLDVSGALDEVRVGSLGPPHAQFVVVKRDDGRRDFVNLTGNRVVFSLRKAAVYHVARALAEEVSGQPLCESEFSFRLVGTEEE